MPDRGFQILLCQESLRRFGGSILGCEQKDAIEALEKLLDSLIQRRPMASFGMTEEKAAEFAESVEKTQQRLLANSYVPMNVPDMAEIYKKLL